MKKEIALIALAAVMLSGCGSSKEDSSSDSDKKTTTTTAPATTTTAATTEPVEEKDPRNAKILLFGDSITDGFWLEGGYRNFLCDKLEENGYSQYVDFTGRLSSGTGYDTDHAGYTSHSIENFSESVTGGRSGVYNRVKGVVQKDVPDAVCLMIGTNDVLSDYELDTADERLGRLVDRFFEFMNEDATIYLATIPVMDANDTTYILESHFTVEYMDECVNKFNEKVKAVAEAKQAEGKNVVLVDANAVLTKEDLYDGVHPSEDGYRKLGDFWYDIIVDYITNY